MDRPRVRAVGSSSCRGGVQEEDDRMLVVHVHARLQPGRIAEFLDATRVNAQASLSEPGVLRFDVLQDEADPAHVVLVEVYRDEAGSVAHKETEHYATWRDAVAPMMAEPRTSVRFRPIVPDTETGWRAARS
jgi:autoinducer 2-degrading protein